MSSIRVPPRVLLSVACSVEHSLCKPCRRIKGPAPAAAQRKPTVCNQRTSVPRLAPGEPKATSTDAPAVQHFPRSSALCARPAPLCPSPRFEAPQGTTSRLAPPSAARPAAQLRVPTVTVSPQAPLCGLHPYFIRPRAPAKPLERVSAHARSLARVRRSALQPKPDPGNRPLLQE